MQINYKGKEVQDIPKNTKYVPIIVRTPDSVTNKAITDIEIIGDSKYAKIGEDVYLWDYDEKQKETRILTTDSYKMRDIYSEYSQMTEIPDELVFDENVRRVWDMFSAVEEKEYTKDVAYQLIAENHPRVFMSSFADRQSILDDWDNWVLTKTKLSKMEVSPKLEIAPMMDTRQITDMSGMFGGFDSMEFANVETGIELRLFIKNSCTALKSIPQYNTSNVTDFSNMFCGCSSLENVPELDTSKGTNFVGMFEGCTSLPEVFPWTLKFDSVNNILYGVKDMFKGSSVVEVSINGYYECTDPETGETVLITPELLDSSGTLQKVKVEINGEIAHEYIRGQQ